jgi:hypothetical protein
MTARTEGRARGAGVRPSLVEYRSSFRNWDDRASVRVKPRRTLESAQPGQVYFPPELVPMVNHPVVAGRGPEAVDRLLVSRLFQYLSFTTVLEATAVIPVTLDISLGRSGLHLPDEMRRDAFKITTDEAWHAQFSDDLMLDVARETGVPTRLPSRPWFVDRLARIRADIDPDLRGATGLAFAIVSENLISSILSDLPKDKRLPRPVRDLIADHAEDEGKHHAYFRSVLDAFWPALDPAQRRRLGPWFPELIRVFLEPDHRSLGYALFDLGLGEGDVARVLSESHPPDAVRGQIVRSATATVRYLREIGALDDPATHEAFLAAGFSCE